MRGLYAIADAQLCQNLGLDLLKVAEALIAAEPAAIQLRAKASSSLETLAWLKQLRRMVPPRVLLFANDRPDLAELAGCDGVHLGQDDLPIADVRQAHPGLKVGISTHNLLQLSSALLAGPDYVAFGPVFETASKLDAEPVVGTQLLQLAYERSREQGVPLCAIGGVSLSTASQIAPRADLGAAISDLVKGPDGETLSLPKITAAARALQRSLIR